LRENPAEQQASWEGKDQQKKAWGGGGGSGARGGGGGGGGEEGVRAGGGGGGGGGGDAQNKLIITQKGEAEGGVQSAKAVRRCRNEGKNQRKRKTIPGTVKGNGRAHDWVQAKRREPQDRSPQI